MKQNTLRCLPYNQPADPENKLMGAIRPRSVSQVILNADQSRLTHCSILTPCPRAKGFASTKIFFCMKAVQKYLWPEMPVARITPPLWSVSPSCVWLQPYINSKLKSTTLVFESGNFLFLHPESKDRWRRSPPTSKLIRHPICGCASTRIFLCGNHAPQRIFHDSSEYLPRFLDRV